MNWLSDLSVRHWLVIILLVNLMVVALLFDHTQRNAEALIKQANEDRTAAMERELKQALTRTTHTLDANTRRLAEWEETRAQFDNPTYYFFWREYSLPNSPFWLPSTLAVRLYKPDGTPLARTAQATDAYLPERIRPMNDQPFTDTQADSLLNHLHYRRFEPAQDSSGRLVGWVGVAYDLLEAMRHNFPFRYLSVSQLQVAGNGQISPKQLMDHLRIRPQPDRLVEQLPDLLQQQAFTFGFGLLLLTLLNGAMAWLLFYRPLRRLHSAIELARIDDETALSRLPPAPVSELDVLRKTLMRTHAHQNEVLQKLRKSRDELQVLALVDPVTGLHNRTALSLHLEEGALELKPPVALVQMDIAHFRAINDTYGPQTGDAVLEEVGRLLEQEDAAIGRYRLGADEFVLIFSGLTSEQLAMRLEALAKRVASLDLEQHEVRRPLKVRFGIVTRDEAGSCDLHGCLAEADAALMVAKQQDRTLQFYHPQLQEHCLLLNAHLVGVIEDAVYSGKGLSLFRQPVIDPRTRAILYHELLVRVRDGDRMIHPGELFQVIDRHHWHIMLDRQIVEQARRLLSRGEIPPGEGISINLNGQTLMGENVDRLLAPLQPWLNSHTIMIEVLETCLIDDKALVRDQLETLRNRGFKVALDDFGSGHASIIYLAELPVDTIKLDRTLTWRLCGEDTRSRKMMRRLVDLLHLTGYRIVLEGIESADQCRFICDLPIDGLQGYLFARPAADTVSADEIDQQCPCHTPSH